MRKGCCSYGGKAAEGHGDCQGVFGADGDFCQACTDADAYRVFSLPEGERLAADDTPRAGREMAAGARSPVRRFLSVGVNGFGWRCQRRMDNGNQVFLHKPVLPSSVSRGAGAVALSDVPCQRRFLANAACTAICRD